RRSHRIARHHRHRRRARAGARHRRDRLRRTLCASGCARAPRAHGPFRRNDREAGAHDRRRSLHLHQPAARDRSAARARVTNQAHDRVDVVIAGAGLVGLSLAAALAGTGLSYALTDRAAVVTGENAAGESAWDSRIYAISPGSAEFLHGIGAWQRVGCDRVQAVESMLIRGDGGAVLEFNAYDLGERALAWIVEERVLRSALVPRVRGLGVPVLAPREI